MLAIVLTQLFVTSRSRRWLNAGLLVAAAIVVAAAVTTWLVLDRQADALAESRDDGADLATTLSTARIVTLRSLSDENLDLIERGTEDDYREDFDVRIDSLGLGETDGLLDRAVDTAPDRASRERWHRSRRATTSTSPPTTRCGACSTDGDYLAAVDVAVDREADGRTGGGCGAGRADRALVGGTDRRRRSGA